jgi:hypothetical protein
MKCINSFIPIFLVLIEAMKHSNTPAKLLLSLGTAPLLLALIGGKAIADLMKDMGQATEELFRGDRLPVLKIVPKDHESQEEG